MVRSRRPKNRRCGGGRADRGGAAITIAEPDPNSLWIRLLFSKREICPHPQLACNAKNVRFHPSGRSAGTRSMPASRQDRLRSVQVTRSQLFLGSSRLKRRITTYAIRFCRLGVASVRISRIRPCHRQVGRFGRLIPRAIAVVCTASKSGRRREIAACPSAAWRRGLSGNLQPQGRASNTILKGVSVALRTLANPPCVIADDSLAKPACAPNAAPTG